MNTLADQYYIKAFDQYPYNLEEAIENLNYALSYNQEHIGANYLMAKLHQEQLNQLSEAEAYYITAMACNPDDINVCLNYISLLILLKEFDKARRLIAYAQKLKGVDLSKIRAAKALIHEHQQHYKRALKMYEKALLNAYHEDSITELNQDIKRVKMKKKLVQKQRAKKSQSIIHNS